MGVNKVEFGGDTLIDLTSDTVTSDNLLKGATAHSADGEQIIGNLIPGGYTKFATGSVTCSTNVNINVDVGFRPSYLIYIQAPNATSPPTNRIVYDENLGNYITFNGGTVINLPFTGTNRIADITDSGFIISKITNASTIGTGIYYAFGGETSPKISNEGDIQQSKTPAKVTLGYKPSKVTVLVGQSSSNVFGWGVHYSTGESNGYRTSGSATTKESPSIIEFLDDGFTIEARVTSASLNCHYIAEE